MDRARIVTLVARRWPLLVTLGVATGTSVGSLGYLLQGIGGFALWSLLGAAAGLAGAGLCLLYLRSFSVTEMTLHVPPVTQVTLAVNQDARDTAWGSSSSWKPGSPSSRLPAATDRCGKR